MTAPFCRIDSPQLLTAREVTQVLREITFGRQVMVRVDDQSAAHPGMLGVDAEGWRISLMLDDARLCYCEAAISPDGRHWTLSGGDRYDPVSLLSTWELATLQALLKP